MDLEIKKQKEDALFERKELEIILKGTGATASRKEVKEELSKKLGVNADLVVIDEIKQSFGKSEATCKAKVYSNEKALAIERKYRLERGTKKKEEKPKEEKKEAPKPEAKK